MHYVTEEELREAYKNAELEQVELDANTRLTPGARQFLIDFHVPIVDTLAKKKAKVKELETKAPVIDKTLQLVQAQSAGAMLRLVAKHAEGIANALAKTLESYGLSWLAGDFVAVEGEIQEAAPVSYLPTSRSVHELYLELSLTDARLYELELSLKSASDDLFTKRFLLDIQAVRASIAEALVEEGQALQHV